MAVRGAVRDVEWTETSELIRPRTSMTKRDSRGGVPPGRCGQPFSSEQPDIGGGFTGHKRMGDRQVRLYVGVSQVFTPDQVVLTIE